MGDPYVINGRPFVVSYDFFVNASLNLLNAPLSLGRSRSLIENLNFLLKLRRNRSRHVDEQGFSTSEHRPFPTPSPGVLTILFVLVRVFSIE